MEELEIDLLDMIADILSHWRGLLVALIIQEPMNSLNPCMRIEKQLTEAILLHNNFSKEEAHNRAFEVLKSVGIPEPDMTLKSYPHQLSGGMCQRVMIAMAMSCEPELLIADEPTTALDVTIQAQILELMQDLQKRLGMAIIIWYSHRNCVVLNDSIICLIIHTQYHGCDEIIISINWNFVLIRTADSQNTEEKAEQQVKIDWFHL